MVLLQPDSSSNGPGAGGKFCNDGVTPRNPKKYTDDEAKDREKARVKERNRKKAGAIAKVEFPIEVRTAWEQKGQPEGNLKAYMLKIFWKEIISSPAEARASASLAESEAAVKNPTIQARKGSVRCNGNTHSLPRFHTACNRIRARCGAIAVLV